MPRRAKKADDVRKVKNPGFNRNTGSNDESSDEEPPTVGQHIPEVHLHRDEADILEGDLEQGELMDEMDSVGGDTQPNDMLALVRNMKREQKELKQQITELTSAQGTDKHEWKKEGFKKQDDIAQKVIGKLDQGLKNLAAHQYLQVRDLVTSAREVLKQRAKELRIADTYEAGWEMVNVYQSHPSPRTRTMTARSGKLKSLLRKGLPSKPRNRGEIAAEVSADVRTTVHGNPERITVISTGTSHTGELAQSAVWIKDNVIRIIQTTDALPAIQYVATVDRPATGRTNAHRKREP